MKLSLQQPMQSILWPQKAQLAINISLVIAGSLLLAVASQIAIPLQPVPITLQTLAVLFLGMAMGWRLGTSSVILYLLMGAAGVQVFSGLAGGTAVLLGSTSGYLFSFIFATALTGFLVQRGWGRSFWTVALAAVAGEFIIFVAGIAVLSTYIGWKAALAAGLLPFIPGEMVKIAILATVVPFLWRSK